HLVFRVIALDAQRACPLTYVHGQTIADGKNVRPICLKNVAIDVWPGFVAWVSLQRRSGLAELQVETGPKATVCRNVGTVLEDQAGLVQAEGVAADIVCAKQVHPPNRVIKVVPIVRINAEVDRSGLEEVQYPSFSSGSSRRTWGRPRNRLDFCSGRRSCRPWRAGIKRMLVRFQLLHPGLQLEDQLPQLPDLRVLVL